MELMEMMDINERIMELSANDVLAIADVTNEIAILEKINMVQIKYNKLFVGFYL